MSLCTCQKYEHTEDCPAYGEDRIFGNKESIKNYQDAIRFVQAHYDVKDEIFIFLDDGCITANLARHRLGVSDEVKKYCKYCTGLIQVMCFQGQTYCSENCRKELEKLELL